MGNFKLQSCVVGKLAASCLAAVCLSAPAFAQLLAGGCLTSDAAKLAVSAVPKPLVLASVAEQPSEASGAASDKSGETFSEKPADYWVPTLFGDMGGLRSALARHGVTLGLSENSEWLRNVRGGLMTGQAYQGLTTLTLGMDSEQAGAWQNGSFYLSALQIHGRQFTQDYLGSIHTASNIEAQNTTRLWELWYQHRLDEKLDIKVGQQSIDQEFMINQYAGPFVAAYFGWPALPSNDLPAGGGIYPLASLGVRIRAKLSDSATLLLGSFVGDAANTSTQDPQIANNRGTTFSLHGGALHIAEMQYAINQAKPADAGVAVHKGLPGVYKIGAWYHNKKFPDMRFDQRGLSLADPLRSGGALQHSGNYSVYGVADQMVWRDSAGGPQAVNLFARAMAAPGDRNLLSFSANFGMTISAPLAGRDSDVVGLGLGYVKVGGNSRGLDADNNAFNATNLPVRTNEAFIEATYQLQATPWLVLQGIVQYTRNPGGGVVNPSDRIQSKRIPNSTVLGLRANVTL